MNRRNFSQMAFQASLFASLPASLRKGNTMLKTPERTDAHVHFFDPVSLSYPWIPSGSLLDRPYQWPIFEPETRRANVRKLLLVESGVAAESRLNEIDWYEKLASKHKKIGGIVAQTNLGDSDQFLQDLAAFQLRPMIKGVRSFLNDKMLASSQLIRNLNHLARFGYSVELLLDPSLLEHAALALRKAPATTFILNHMGKPNLSGSSHEWRRGIKALASLPHVYCKLSGLLPGENPMDTASRLLPYLEHLIGNFGFDRLMYAGDWPVLLRQGSYSHWVRAIDWLLGSYPEEQQRKCYYENAERIYRM